MSEAPRLGAAAAIVAGGVALSRLLGLGREVAIAALLGRTVESDLYQQAFLIPDYAYYLVAGGFLSITLVPILARHLESDAPEEANVAFSAVFRFVAGLLLALTVIAAIAAGPLVDVVFPEVTGEAAGRLVAMTRIALVLQVLFALGALFSAGQFVHRRFLVPTVGPLIYNIGIIAGGLVGAAADRATPEAFLLGGLAGAAVGSFGLQWWGARREGVRLVRAPRRHDSIREYLTLAVPLMLGQTVIALDEQWPRLFGQFGAEGTTAGLTWARRLTMVPVGVVAQAAGVAAYPFLARLAARDDRAELRSVVDRSVRTGVVVALPITAVVVIAAEPLTRIAFQWGEFGSADTTFVAGLLAIYALAIPVWVVHQVVTRAFYADRRMWVPVIVGTALTVVTVPLLFLANGDAESIASVATAAVAAYGVVIALVWYRTSPTDSARSFRTFVARLAVAVGAATIAALGGAALPAAVVVAPLAWVVVFVAVGSWLRLEELDLLRQRLVRPR